MKKIEINGLVLYYKVEYVQTYDGYYHDTEFYLLKGKKEEVKWSWRKFRFAKTGKMIDNYVEAFSISVDIESPRYTKSDIRSMIKGKIELMGRAEEIEKGEII